MNKLTLSEWITADNGTRNEYLEQIIADAENEIAKQNAIITWAREQISPATDEPVKHSIRWVNTDNLAKMVPYGVAVHGAECRDLDKLRKDPAVRAGLETISDPESWVTAKGFATDYNADFYDEAGLDGCHTIAFFPCTGMVEKTTVTTGYDDLV